MNRKNDKILYPFMIDIFIKLRVEGNSSTNEYQNWNLWYTLFDFKIGNKKTILTITENGYLL